MAVKMHTRMTGNHDRSFLARYTCSSRSSSFHLRSSDHRPSGLEVLPVGALENHEPFVDEETLARDPVAPRLESLSVVSSMIGEKEER